MLCAGWAAAQQPAGSVSGHVIAQDTQRPVRFATVMLQSVASVTGGGDEERRGGGGAGSNTRTDAEGNFTSGSVDPGDYYVTAIAPGYISERALLQAAVSAGGDPAALLAQLPVVHVTAGETSPVTVTIERGGAISGKVTWEDGSPAAGVSLNAVSPGAASGAGFAGVAQLPGVLQQFQSAGGGGNFAMTDDRGVFRITGLAGGDYLLRSQIQVPPQFGSTGRVTLYAPPIRVYSPGVFRRADAKPVTVKVGEERSDVRMTIDLHDLRTVTGHASSAIAGQAVASGRVSLVDANESDLLLGGSIASNGDFTVRYVPAGSYTLKISGASTQATTNRGRNSDANVSYQPFSKALVVGDADVSGVGVTLTPVAAQP
jgi:hypothetical protein